MEPTRVEDNYFLVNTGCYGNEVQVSISAGRLVFLRNSRFVFLPLRSPLLKKLNLIDSISRSVRCQNWAECLSCLEFLPKLTSLYFFDLLVSNTCTIFAFAIILKISTSLEKIIPRKMNNKKVLLRDHKRHTTRGVGYTLLCPDHGVLPLDRTRNSTKDTLPNQRQDQGIPLTPTPHHREQPNFKHYLPVLLRVRVIKTSFSMLLLSDKGKNFCRQSCVKVYDSWVLTLP